MRRAPFSDNPRVGARGQRTQQRVLDAALAVLGEVGYHQCSIEGITRIAGCSRASFYQYFSGKDDVFRHLAMQVSRQLDAATDWLEPITPGADGWAAMRTWVGRCAEIYDRHEPVFHSFPVVAESDARLAADLARAGRRYVTSIQARVEASPLAPRALDPIIELLLECLARTLDDFSTLRASAPWAYPRPPVLDGFTDVAHRTLFGRLPGVNVHEHELPPPPKLPFGPVMSTLERDERLPGRRKDGPTRDALLAAARGVFAQHGYHGTSIDAIVDGAGVSHGTFYHYFENKHQLAYELAAEALRAVSATLGEIPDPAPGTGDRAALRRWLQAYNHAQASETAMIRVWLDASLQDDRLMTDSAPMLDWGRRRMVRFLGGRGFGDVEREAIVLLALLDGLGVRERPPRTLDAALAIIERGFLGC